MQKAALRKFGAFRSCISGLRLGATEPLFRPCSVEPLFRRTWVASEVHAGFRSVRPAVPDLSARRADAAPSSAGTDKGWDSGTSSGARLIPLRVRYSLTPYGRTLVPVLEALCSWGREHLQK